MVISDKKFYIVSVYLKINMYTFRSILKYFYEHILWIFVYLNPFSSIYDVIDKL